MLSRHTTGIVLSGLLLCHFSHLKVSAQQTAEDLFAKKNLMAWCIVPFDSRKRGPEERAAMLEKLGFSKFAYDYRVEHIPTFDAEIEALKKHHVELSAWWFPTALNDEARLTLSTFARHQVTPQLWVTGGGGPTKDDADQRARVVAEAGRIRPIAEAAAKVGCKVALYNHGGWFGEPENQIAIIHELKLDNVGIVYNLHHGHDHLERFPELLKKMIPYLYTLNLNGMVKEGDKKGQKILQLGQGDLDLKLLKTIQDSGYNGPIGILGHTQDDAEERLQDNLDGLNWLLPQLKGQPASAKPKMRTPVPQPAVAATPTPPTATAKPVAEGRFGQALNGRSGGAFVAGRDQFRQFPLTVECWAKLADKGVYNILIAHEQKSSGTHWELFSMAGTGNFTVYLPGFSPDHCHSQAMICDNQWHYVAMVLELDRVQLFVDGRRVSDQPHKWSGRATEPGGLSLATLVDKAIGCTGLIDDVRISKGVRPITAIPQSPFEVDESTISLWNFDLLLEQKRFEDRTPAKIPAVLSAAGQAASPPSKTVSQAGKIEGHWGEDAIGFRWTEADSRDDRFGKVDSGSFFSGSITGPGGPVYKGIVIRLGENREFAVCYDTELLRMAVGWNGFLRFDPARFGIIVPPRVDGPKVFETPRFPGWSLTEQFANFRELHPYGPLPRNVAHYKGLYRNGRRTTLRYSVGTGKDEAGKGRDQSGEVTILESPWLESSNGLQAITRTIKADPCGVPLRMLVSDGKGRVRLHPTSQSAALSEIPGVGRILEISPHDKAVTIKLILAAPDADEVAFNQLVNVSPIPEDLGALTQPGLSQWGPPLVTQGEVAGFPSKGEDSIKQSKLELPAYVVDTITLPFKNPYGALMFCAGHDFLPDGRAAVCMMHGDVWLVDGIDESLAHITWRRFATGLFQPLGLRVVNGTIYVVGRDQITRLLDTNDDGEADIYENFNNDAHVTLNGHEYVTCLETDRAGNFYYVKGNCNSQTPHDGSLLRVSADGSKLDVFATGFRNSNGIGMGPRDEITVAPQEGEWTPASGVFLVREGGFYGGMMSHHRPVPPTDFERPLVWFPRLADNSSGGQVWTTSDRWGPLANQLLHMSYGQCRLRLVLQDRADPGGTRLANGSSIELPLRFNSGIHRGRMNPRDGQLYVTGLKGWTTSAVHDGCFQRVRHTGQPIDIPIEMKSYRNGISLTFTRELERESAEDPANYQLEAWNYKWSAAYGSPEFKVSAPGQVGRDDVEVRSVTLLPNDRTVFLELADLKAVDQLSINYSLASRDRREVEQSVIVTLNTVSTEPFPEASLHRRSVDVEQAKLVSSLVPGIRVRTGLGENEVRSQRLIAWILDDVRRNEQAAGTPRTVTAAGWIKIPSTGRYRFTAEASPATVEFSVGKSLNLALSTEAVEVFLNRGIHPLRVVQKSSGQGEVRLRMLWESNRFPREAIPATVLMQLPDPPEADLRHSGALLFNKLRCGNCHKNGSLPSIALSSLEGEDSILKRQQPPSLEGIGSRLDSKWISAWIRQPHQLRNGTTMPAVIGIDDLATSNDIAAYLATLKGTTQKAVDPSPLQESSERERSGAELYEQLGCIACHTFSSPDRDDEWRRISLQFVNSKFRPGALVEHLLNPQAHYPGSRMPDFRLTRSEAEDLAVYVQHESKGRLPEVEGPPGNVERGREAFQKSRCQHCHTVDREGSMTGANVAAVRSAISDGMISRGCLAEGPGKPRSGVIYHLNDSERLSLVEFIKAAEGPPEAVRSMSKGREFERWMVELRCHACHARDARQSLWPEIVAEDGSGKPVETVPQLTWVGEKLQGPWVERLIAGKVTQKPRPWIKARMPAFPAYAALVAHELAAEHAVPFQESLPKSLDPDRVELGRRLTIREGGLDCRQCHGVGSEQPRGDASTQIALGVNFAMTKQRLRPEFALRQMLDPPRYDVGSRMPRFAPDLKTTAATQIEAGDARKQFELLKEYLWSIEP